ncbi:MAG: hypothetical protein QNJ68_18415 [Microcoleaceae cyanobacterium MO_207.B10]|nr:hypothetical protein [Microcoleaceae cyanobacterium MO_207.B10]
MKLIDYFQINKENFCSELKKAKTPDRVVDILTGEIRRLNGEYIEKLIPSQANVALALLDMFERSVKLSTGIKEDYSQYINRIFDKSISLEDAKKIENTKIYPIIGAIAGGSAGALFGPFVSMLSASAGAFLGEKMKSELVEEKTKSTDSRTWSAPEPQLQLDADILISKFEEQLKAIDELVIKYGTPSEPPKPKLEDHPATLKFFQNCLKQKHQGIIPPLLMEELNYLLDSSEIEIQDYDPNSNDNRYQEFEFVPNHDSKNYETIKPALLKGDRVILKGVVREPMSDT